MRNYYTKEIIEYIKNNYKGKSNVDLSKEINEKFNLNTTNNCIQMLKTNIRRRNGFEFDPVPSKLNSGCFKKGNIPFNKGKKGLTGANKTSFKKGHKPQNYRPLGSERITKDGYLEVKVAEPNKWDGKHRVVYREYYGEIPEGYVISFLDGNKLNTDISNLALIKRSENLIMNRKKLYFEDKELTKSGHLIAKVIDIQRNQLSEKENI